MPLTYPLAMSGGVIREIVGSISADDATSQRFEVKADMNFYVHVDFSNPTSARMLLLAGETIDTDDQATIDVLMVQPELTHIGDTP